MDSERRLFMGQSPVEFYCSILLSTRLDHPHGAIRLSRSLSIKDLQGSRIFLNARALMLHVTKFKGGIAATNKGNLPRTSAAELLRELTMDSRLRESTESYYKTLNEADVPGLHVLRVVLQCAGLIALRKGKFTLTKVGRTLIEEDKAGELFRHLFIGYAERYNMGYSFPYRDVPAIQQTFPVILWRLSSIAADWVPVKGLGKKVLMQYAQEQVERSFVSDFDREEFAFSGLALRPLSEFGLIEKKSRDEWPGVESKDSIRITPLWWKFIQFVNEPHRLMNN